MSIRETTYKNGLPFNDELALNIKDLDERVQKNKKASLIVVDGVVGEGKTTLGIEIADYINKLHNLPPVDLDSCDQLGLGGEDFLQKLRVCFEKKLPVCIYDEAGDFSRRGALTRFNAMINRTFETFRAFKILVIVVLPNFNVLDQPLFDNGIPRMLVHCYDRTTKYGQFVAFDYISMLFIRNAMQKEVVKQRTYFYFNPNHHGEFKNLDKKRELALERSSINAKLDILLESEMKIAGLLDMKLISARLGKSVQWVGKSISQLKIRPVKKIKTTKYYDENIISVLDEYSLQLKNK